MSRELLEKAAKAGGYDIDWSDFQGRGYATFYRIRGTTAYWNAEADDGDAFRLAVKLNLRVVFHPALNQALVREYHSTYREWVENGENHSDPYAATRLAIVRAAAEIGRAMP